MSDFYVVFSIAHVVIAVLGMALNLFLIYLSLFQTPKIIRSYATLIVNFAVTDFFACFFDLFVQQRIIPAGVTLGHVSNGFCKYFGPTACHLGYSLMLNFLSHSLWSLLLSFSYRYYILFKPTPSRHTLTLIICIIYIPSFFQWVSFMWAQDEPEEIATVLQEKFPAYNLTDQCVTGTKDIFCFSALYTILHMTLPVGPVYICILILRKKIITHLSIRGLTISSNTYNLHTQLLMALTYQAAFPGFYLFSVTSYVIGQFGIYNHPILEYFTFSCAVLVPFFSPVASLVFVTPYQRFIKESVFKMKKGNAYKRKSIPKSFYISPSHFFS